MANVTRIEVRLANEDFCQRFAAPDTVHLLETDIVSSSSSSSSECGDSCDEPEKAKATTLTPVVVWQFAADEQLLLTEGDAEEDSIATTMAAIDVKKPISAPPGPPPAPLAKPEKPLMMREIGGGGSSNGSAANGHGEPPMRKLELNGHVGFDSLPHQLVRKAVEMGFQFNLMCVGETGIGKTTLIESLFNMKLEIAPCSHELKTVELRSKTYDVQESFVRLKLTIVETAGFGDQLDKDKSAKVIVEYINEQFEKYLKEELKIKRCLDLYDDTRIHACLYFISPTGHGLKALDIVTMRELSKRVNVIPVIAKSDTTCKDELARFKTKILAELRAQNIPVYQFPTDDETVRAINADLNQIIPYAVVGSTDFVKKENGKSVRARRYPWGMVEVENEEHCDFVKLREALLRQNVDALRERTHAVLYESYRRERLREMGVQDGDTGPRMVEACDKLSRTTNDDLARREQQLKDEFVSRVTRKEEELKHAEEEMNQRERVQDEQYQREMQQLEAELAQVRDATEQLQSAVRQLNSNGGQPSKKKK